MAHLIDLVNEAEVVVHEVAIMALIDTRVQVSTIEYSFTKQLGLQMQKLDMGLKLEGTRGFLVPYLVIVEVNLWIPLTSQV